VVHEMRVVHDDHQPATGRVPKHGADDEVLGVTSGGQRWAVRGRCGRTAANGVSPAGTIRTTAWVSWSTSANAWDNTDVRRHRGRR